MDYNIYDHNIRQKPKKIIYFYIFVIILSIAIVIATILVTYRYFYGTDDTDEYAKSDYNSERSEIIEKANKKEVEEIVPQNIIPNEGQNNIENVTIKEENVLPKHNIEESIASLFPKYDETTQSKVKNAQTSDEKSVYLTFDDGPSLNVTPQILDTLKKYNVKATFFVLGKNVDLYPELTKRAYKEGNYIANHGYTHSYSTIYSNPRNVLNEYERTEKSIQKAIGVNLYNSHLFRFPGGSSGGVYNDVKSVARKILEQHNVAHTNWNCLTGDAEGYTSVDAQLKRLYSTAKGYDSLVILMHDAAGKSTTAEALPKIIEHYQSLGYTFKTYYDIMK